MPQQIPGPSKDGNRRTVQQALEFLLDSPANHHLLRTDQTEINITLRFACDGAKLTKYKDSVRAVFKLIQPKEHQTSHLNDSPEDEITLFIYMGQFTCYVALTGGFNSFYSFPCENQISSLVITCFQFCLHLQEKTSVMAIHNV